MSEKAGVKKKIKFYKRGQWCDWNLRRLRAELGDWRTERNERIQRNDGMIWKKEGCGEQRRVMMMGISPSNLS